MYNRVKKYKFIIEETLSKSIEIEAEDMDTEVSIIEKMYTEEDIVLSSEDFSEYKINYIENN